MGVYVKSSGDLFQFDDVRDQPSQHLWTVVDSSCDLLPGRFGSRVGRAALITSVPFSLEGFC